MRLAQHQKVTGLRDVLRRRAPMHPAAMRLADDAAELPDQRHQRMAGAGEAFVDALAVHQLELRICSNRLRGLGGDDAELGLGVGEGGLDVEPGLPAVLQPIERAHAGIGDAGCGRKSVGHGPSLIGGPDWRLGGGDLSKSIALPCEPDLRSYSSSPEEIGPPTHGIEKELARVAGFRRAQVALHWPLAWRPRRRRRRRSRRTKMVFYFGACAGGVWKTNDGGMYWQLRLGRLLRHLGGRRARRRAVRSQRHLRRHRRDDDPHRRLPRRRRLQDRPTPGARWTHVGLRDSQFIGKIRVHPQNPDLVYVAALGHAFGPNSERGVFRSQGRRRDLGAVLFRSDKAGAVDLTLDPNNPRILYASIWEAYRNFWNISSGGPDSGLWRAPTAATPGRRSRRKPGLPKGIWARSASPLSPARPGRVWALVEAEGEGRALPLRRLRHDAGRGVATTATCLTAPWYYIHVSADPVDADTVYVNNLQIWKSTDGGKTFTEIATPHGDNHDLWIDPKDTARMIQGNDGGANVSFNGGHSWSHDLQPADRAVLSPRRRQPVSRTASTARSRTTPRSAVPSASERRASRWPTATYRRHRRERLHRRRPARPEHRLRRRDRLSPGGGNALQRYDHRTRQIRLVTVWPEIDAAGRRGPQVPLRLDLPHRLLAARPGRSSVGGNSSSGRATRA